MEEFAKNIAEKTNYLNKEIVYLKNTTISEYDIRSAGFTVIKFKKLLPPEEIAELEKIDKERRNILIGKRILSYPKISEEIINTLAEIRKNFVVLNQIHEDEILSIKKDALYLIKKIPTVLNLDIFEFRAKEKYTSYCYVNNKEFYYSSMTNKLDVKGLSEEVRNLQENYLLKDIKKIMSMAEKLTPDQLFLILKQYRSKYLNRQLDKEAYRDMETGKYEVNGYYLDTISDDIVDNIDISQNYINYLVPLFKALI
jgi:hypothetical protein